MHLEIITIGREILDGRVLDTNSVTIALALKKIGIVPTAAQKVDDNPTRMYEAFRIASTRSQIILVSGGLGPTSDDRTTELFARHIGKPLVFYENAFREIESYFKKMGREMSGVQKKQAYFPEGATLLPNPNGTAAGFWMEHAGAKWFFFPGPPRELGPMLENYAIPLLPTNVNYRSLEWATHFTSEGKLQELLKPIEDTLPPGCEITYRTRFPENFIGLHGTKEGFEKTAHEIEEKLGDTVFSARHPVPLESVVLSLLTKKNLWITTVESCTGGLIAKRLTDVNGSSKSFFSGSIPYDNEAKIALGVPRELIVKHGAVSEEVAKALAEAGLKLLERAGKKGISISTTGVAGPTGGTEEKPTGLCYVGLHCSGDIPKAWRIQSPRRSDRDLNRLYFSQFALERVRLELCLSERPSPPLPSS